MQEKFSFEDLLHIDRIKKIYFSSEGRINRLEYFTRNIGLVLLLGILQAVSYLFFFILQFIIGDIVAGILSLVVSVATLIMLLAAQYHLDVMRLHDLNRSGKLAIAKILTFIILIPVVIIGLIPDVIIGIYLFFFKGTTGPNDYGPDPLENQK